MELESTIKKIAEMQYKMEAFTLSRNCMTQFRVMHFMRIVPPRQLERFLQSFDKILRAGFEELVGTRLDDRW